jgi:hypothetical protein
MATLRNERRGPHEVAERVAQRRDPILIFGLRHVRQQRVVEGVRADETNARHDKEQERRHPVAPVNQDQHPGGKHTHGQEDGEETLLAAPHVGERAEEGRHDGRDEQRQTETKAPVAGGGRFVVERRGRYGAEVNGQHRRQDGGREG